MDKKSIIGLVLIFAIFMGYMWFISPTKEQQEQMRHERDSMIQAYNDSVAEAALMAKTKQLLDTTTNNTDSSSMDQALMLRQAKLGVFAACATGDTTNVAIQNDVFEVEISPMGASVQSVVLKDFTTFDSLPLQLITPSNENMNLTFSTVDNRVINTNQLVFTPLLNGKPYAGEKIHLSNQEKANLSFRACILSEDGVVDPSRYLEFAYTFYGDSYNVDFDINIHGLAAVVNETPYMDFAWNNTLNRQEKVDQSSKGSRNRNKDVEKFYTSLYFKASGEKKVDNLRLGSDGNKNVKTSVEWIAFKQQFFTSILWADSVPFENADLASVTDRENTDKNYLTDMKSTIGVTYNSNGDNSMKMHLYYGPTKFRSLRAMNHGFEKMIPLGYGPFSRFISRYVVLPVFNFLERFNWNYGIIIIVLTFLMRLVLFPLTYKSYQGSAIMRILKPDMDALNAKFPRQEQAMQKQQAMMQLQRKAGYNPMVGCLPILIQFPILTAMFRFFPLAIELRQKPFLWCDDLSSYDSILNFGFNIPLYGDHISLFCLLMFSIQLFYTWYTMKGQSTDAMPGMKFMMYFMPFMMLFMFNSQSAALNLYYFISLSLTMIQMILIRKFTSESKIRARMAAYDDKMKKKGGKGGGKKSKFQQKLEELQKMQEEMQRQQAAQARR